MLGDLTWQNIVLFVVALAIANYLMVSGRQLGPGDGHANAARQVRTAHDLASTSRLAGLSDERRFRFMVEMGGKAARELSDDRC
jgi:hypothetical protein